MLGARVLDAHHLAAVRGGAGEPAVPSWYTPFTANPPAKSWWEKLGKGTQGMWGMK